MPPPRNQGIGPSPSVAPTPSTSANTGYAYNYGANPGKSSSNDPKGRLQNQSMYLQQRNEEQQDPLMAQAGYNYANASTQNMGDYTNLMNGYMSIANGGGGDGGGGGGGGGYNAAGQYTPFTIGYSDPFNSYAGFQDFSTTGGYSPADIANMRARGVSPIRAAYANAQREVGRQRSLQGGYSPNAIATLASMARTQGQSAADATQNVEAGLASERQKGKLAGLTGMSGIEGQRLGADLQVAQYNADAQARAQAQNISAAQSAAAGGAAASAQNTADRLAALNGGRMLLGTTPGMANTFGDQAYNFYNAGGTFSNNLYQNDINAQRAPGEFDQTMSRINSGVNTGLGIYNDVSKIVAPYLDPNKRQPITTPPYSPGPMFTPDPNSPYA